MVRLSADKNALPRNTRARFRARVVTHDVTPSLNVYYKSTRTK
jgi:hypothetical protein